MKETWDSYFIKIAEDASIRSTCLRRSVGAVIVKDNRTVSTGYNGSPTHTFHCEKVGCKREQLGVPSGERHELCRAVHAEQNAIVSAARFGASIDEATIYVTHFPCIICAKLIINSNIKEVIYKEDYPGKEEVLELFEEAGIICRQIED